MKKILTLLLSALMLLTACSSNKASETTTTVQTEAVTTTTAATTEATTTTAEPEPPMMEIKIEGMTVKLDPAKWETWEEYTERMDKTDTPVSEEDKEDLASGNYGHVFTLRDTVDHILTIDAVPFEGIEEGFGTKEDYERYIEGIGIAQQDSYIDFHSKVSERNGLMFADCIYSNSVYYVQLCVILKDKKAYGFLYAGFEKRIEKEPVFALLDTVSFE